MQVDNKSSEAENYTKRERKRHETKNMKHVA